MAAALEKRVGNLGEAAIQREPPRKGDRCFGLISIRTARTLELEAAIVGDVYHLVGVVDQEHIRGDSQSPEIRGGSQLVKVRSRQSRLIGPLDDAASVDAVDPPAVVRR